MFWGSGALPVVSLGPECSCWLNTCFKEVLVYFLKFIYLFIYFLAALLYMRDLSSLTRD